MRIIGDPAPIHRLLWRIQVALWMVGLSMLGYCGLVAADAWIFARRAEAGLRTPRDAQLPVPTPRPGGIIGRIQIPRLGLSAVILEGTTRTALRRGAGHIQGTGLPGMAGNIGVAGHRDTFFRALKDVHPNDVISIRTPLGDYRYRVVSTGVVGPTEMSVLNITTLEILTLVTCYPFDFIGPAPDRFIVRAERVIA